MAILAFTEDFDSLAAWTQAPSAAWIARTGTTGTGVGSNGTLTLTRALPGAAEHATVVIGVACKSDSLSANRAVITLMSDTAVTTHLVLVVTTTGGLQIRRSTITGTVLASSAAGVFVANTWHYVELKATLHDTTGAVEARINGVSVCSASSIDTKNAGTKTVFDAVRLSGSSNNWYYDDLYAQTGADAAFLGVQRYGTDTDVLHEPFDDLAAWTVPSGGGTPSIVAGRTGNAVRLDSTEAIAHTYAAEDRVAIVGFALFVPTSPTPVATNILQFMEAGSPFDSIQLSETGAIGRSGVGFSAAGAVTFGAWNYIEVRWLAAGAIGTAITIRVNDVVVRHDENISITAHTIDGVRLTGMSGSGMTVDDLYIRSGGLADFEGDQALVETFVLTISVVGFGSVDKWPWKDAYDDGETVWLEALPGDDQEFIGWSGDLSGTTNPQPLLMDAAKSVTATFALIQRTLTVNVVGSGTVAKSPNKATYDHGEVVTLTATPSAGWTFSDWTASVGGESGTENPKMTTMTVDKTFTATFVQQPVLTVDIAGSGSVAKSPNQAFYNVGTVVTLTATPATGSVFQGWGGALSGSVNPTTVTMDVSKTVEAMFTLLPQHTVAVTVIGGGTVVRNPNQTFYVAGSTVTLTATANTGWQFQGWSGDLVSTALTANVTVNSDKAITATFIASTHTQSQVFLDHVHAAIRDQPTVDLAIAELALAHGPNSLEARLATAYRDYEPLGVTPTEMRILKQAVSGTAPYNKEVELGPQPPRGGIDTGRYTSDVPVSWGRSKPSDDRPLPWFGVDPVAAYSQGAGPFMGVRVYVVDSRSAFRPD